MFEVLIMAEIYVVKQREAVKDEFILEREQLGMP
jgi:hypothetical protein